VRFFNKLSKEEKSILLYLQNYVRQFPNTPTNEFNYIWQGAGLDKIDAKNALKKLVEKKLITKKPSDKKTEEQRELFGNVYRITPSGFLYKFTSRWSILTAIGMTITTISAIIVTTIALYQYFLNNPFWIIFQ